MNWRDGESNLKNLQHSAAFFPSVSITRPRRRSENTEQNVAFKHRIRSICLYRHYNALPLHFGKKRPRGTGVQVACMKCLSSSLSYSAGAISCSFSAESLVLVHGLDWFHSHL